MKMKILHILSFLIPLLACSAQAATITIKNDGFKSKEFSHYKIVIVPEYLDRNNYLRFTLPTEAEKQKTLKSPGRFNKVISHVYLTMMDFNVTECTKPAGTDIPLVLSDSMVISVKSSTDSNPPNPGDSETPECIIESSS